MEEKNEPRFLETITGFWVVVLVVIAIYFGAGYFMWDHYFRHSPSQAGTFGDMFGVVTSFFGAMTVILVFYASRLQKQELDATRAELRRQVAAANEMSETASKQNRNLVLQRFENTLFNLINLHYQNVEFFRKTIPNPAFVTLYHQVQRNLTRVRDGGNIPNFFVKDYGDFIKAYNHHDIGEVDTTSNYYRHVVNILTFIKDSTLSDKRRKFYLNTFLSLLSSHEKTLLYFYIAFDETRNKENELIQKFCLEHNVFAEVDDLPNDTYKNILTAW